MFVMVETVHADYPDRVLVRWRRGVPGQTISWTETCRACTPEEGNSGPLGCEECGYTRSRRRSEWVPLVGTARAEAFRKRRKRWTRRKP